MSVTELPDRHDEAPAQFGRTPPQDVEAEQAVLGGMLLSKDAIADVVEVLRGYDFYRPAHEQIYEAVLDLYGRGEPADALTVAAELQKRNEIGRIGGAPYIHTLVSSVPSAANAGYYANIVRQHAILRRLIEAGTRVVQMGYGGDGDADDIVDRAQAEIYGVTDKRASEDYLPLSDIMEGALDEIEAIGSRDGEMVGVPTGFSDLDGLTNGLHPGQMVIVAARPAIGKALALDTRLPTPHGWTTMGDVGVGDFLIGADGRPTRVEATTNVLEGRPCYEVEFSDGSVIVADAQHQWATSTRASRRAAAERQAPRFSGPIEAIDRVRALSGAVKPQGALLERIERPMGSSSHARDHKGSVTTEEIAATLRCGDRLNHAVRLAHAFELPERDLTLPPYTLGVWLGDGHSKGARFTSADPQVADEIRKEGLVVTAQSGLNYSIKLPHPPSIPERECVVCGRTFTRRSSGLRRCQECHRSHGTVAGVLRTMGVWGNKHIPRDYLRASTAQRRALLAGLLDTDGYVNSNGTVQIAVTNERLAKDALELVHSLGYRARINTKTVNGHSESSSTSYCVTLAPGDPVFRLERKLASQKFDTGPDSLMITDVRPVDSVPVRCVEVDAADHLYLAGPHCVPTHNSTLGLDVARAASIKHGLTSVIFSLEMSRNEITMRLLSAEAKVPLHHMRAGQMTDDDWNRIARCTGEVSNAPLFIDDSPNMTMMEIRAKCRRLKQRNDLKLVILDYLQLMTSGKKVESRQQEVSEFSRALKLLAKELEVPVIAIAQLNRGPEQRTDKKPMLSDLRESGSLEQDADAVILLHRDDAYEKESPRAGEADFIVAKHRNGPTATITVAFQGHYSRFVDMAH